MKKISSYNIDTSPDIQDLQYDLLMSRSAGERLLLGLEMMENGQELMLSGIRSQKPGLSEEEYKIELLKRMMMHDPSLHWLKKEYPHLFD